MFQEQIKMSLKSCRNSTSQQLSKMTLIPTALNSVKLRTLRLTWMVGTSVPVCFTVRLLDISHRL